MTTPTPAPDSTPGPAPDGTSRTGDEPSLRGHHCVLVGAAESYGEDLLAAIDAGDAPGFGVAHGTLASWCQFELVPALAALEQDLYPLAGVDADLLRQGLVADHRVAAGLVDAVNGATDAARLAGDATALRVLVRSTLAKVDELLVPAIARTAGRAALEDAVAQVPRTAGELSARYAQAVQADVDAAHARTESGCGGGGCGSGGCGGVCGTASDDPRTPEQRAADRDAVTVTRVD